MKPINFFFVLVSAFFASCANESKTGKQYKVIDDKSEIFKVSVELTMREDDALHLYYTTDSSINFTDVRSIWIESKGNQKKQRVVFSLPEQIKPTQLRIDLGNNPKQKDIYLSKVTLSYKGKSVELPGTLVFSYFTPDVTKTDANLATGLIRGRILHGVRQSPSLYPKEGPLGDELEKLLTP